VLTMGTEGIRALEVAGARWIKVRPDSLRSQVVSIAGQATDVLVFIDDESGVEVTVPRHVVSAYDGTFIDVEAEAAARRRALAEEEARRRAELVAGAHAEYAVRGGTLFVGRPGPGAVKAIDAAYVAELGRFDRNKVDAVMRSLVVGGIFHDRTFTDGPTLLAYIDSLVSSTNHTHRGDGETARASLGDHRAAQFVQHHAGVTR
jgi:hypothetical protein